MTPSRSKNAALVKEQHLFANVSPELRSGPSGQIEALAKALGTRVIFGCPDVDEHSVLLERIYSMFEQSWKYFLFKAGWSFWNVLQNGAVEHVHTAIYDARNRGARLLTKSNDSIYARPLQRFRNAPHLELCVPPC